MKQNEIFSSGQLIGDYGIAYIKEIDFEKDLYYNKPIRKTKNRKAWFQCGVCGEVFPAIVGNIKSGNTSSCGCIKIKDYTNKQFGYLKVLCPTELRSNDGRILWKCQCQKCGKIKLYRMDHLVQGDTVSCGCLKKSIAVDLIKNILDKNKIIYEEEKTFKKCINPLNNYHLYFDFYLPDYNCCIEYDGELHYQSSTFFGGEEKLKELQYRDDIKNQYCKNNNIKLIRIPYWEQNNIKDEYILNKLED